MRSLNDFLAGQVPNEFAWYRNGDRVVVLNAGGREVKFEGVEHPRAQYFVGATVRYRRVAVVPNQMAPGLLHGVGVRWLGGENVPPEDVLMDDGQSVDEVNKIVTE